MAKKKVSKKTSKKKVSKKPAKQAPAKQAANLKKVEAAITAEATLRQKQRAFAAQQAKEFNKQFAK
jgi:hypothetical protein